LFLLSQKKSRPFVQALAVFCNLLISAVLVFVAMTPAVAEPVNTVEITKAASLATPAFDDVVVFMVAVG
jgi:hypothetical protein